MKFQKMKKDGVIERVSSATRTARSVTVCKNDGVRFVFIVILV